MVVLPLLRCGNLGAVKAETKKLKWAVAPKKGDKGFRNTWNATETNSRYQGVKCYLNRSRWKFRPVEPRWCLSSRGKNVTADVPTTDFALTVCLFECFHKSPPTRVMETSDCGAPHDEWQKATGRLSQNTDRIARRSIRNSMRWALVILRKGNDYHRRDVSITSDFEL